MRKFVIAVSAMVAWPVVPADAETTRCTKLNVLPVTLVTPGIYCLKSHITINKGRGYAIRIGTDDVVIDLNGFTLRNTRGPANTADGIVARSKRNIVIRNGTIEGFFRGIHFANDGSANHLVETVRAIGNGHAGIWVEGENVVVRNNQVSQTGPSDAEKSAYGILVAFFKNARVSNNTVSDTSETAHAMGIYAVSGSHLVIEKNMVSDTNSATTTYAIYLNEVDRAHIASNHLVNQFSGSYGIRAKGAGITCSNNYIDAFATMHQTCSSISGTLP